MKPEDYMIILQEAHVIAGSSESRIEALAEAIKAAQQAESLGSILDPTLYRNKGDALREDIFVLEAVYGLAVKMQNLRNTRRT